MKNEHQTFGQQLAHLIRAPGTGARMQSASSGSGAAGGNTGTSAELTTRATPDGRTQREWMMGDPWTDDYFFKAWRPNQ